MTAYAIYKGQGLYKSIFQDNELTGKQKFHIKPVPRVGGIAVLAGILIAKFPIWMIIASIPIFAGGLLEDITKKVSPISRLFFSFVSAMIAIYGLDLGLQSIGWPLVDNIILNYPIVSILLTVLIIGGISNSANIIDGFNGLLIGFSLMAFTIFAFVAFSLEDQFLLIPIIATIASLLGVLFFNFPKGLIFLGDGGAYLIGFLLSIFSLILLNRHPDISPWLPILVLSYPIFELLFSIYRKKLLRGNSPLMPDGIHLHMLVYKRIVPKYFGIKKKGWQRNACTSLIMIFFIAPTMILSLFFWENNIILMMSTILFCLFYIFIYFSIIRFKLNYSIIFKIINFFRG
jgi:UDP-GlcNAc:undecaprenyl-phosphate/decaprenyl-phosphate GlcNAc-1-phosphate transferase